MNGDELRRLRERRQWSQADLAAAINAALGKKYGSGSISPWETGKRNIPVDVAVFLDELAVDTALPSDDDASLLSPAGERGDDAAADTAPGSGQLDSSALPAQPSLGGGGAYARACRELWELIASGVGMVGAATGSALLMNDGAIIAGDAQALGDAWGRLAETNATFRKMLIGMTEGGAWLQVALVTGTTVSKCYQSHAQYALAVAENAETNGSLGNVHEPEAA
ncbi:MAG TPA: helix-turn-helix domain-containing protein [Kofleriaceae bacterium]